MRKHRFGERLVVGFLRIEPDGAIVADTELTRAETLEAGDQGKVVEEAAECRPRLAEPEGRLDHRDDARPRHCLIVVGRPGDHVRVRIDDDAGRGATRDSFARLPLTLSFGPPLLQPPDVLKETGKLVTGETAIATRTRQRRVARAIP